MKFYVSDFHSTSYASAMSTALGIISLLLIIWYVHFIQAFADLPVEYHISSPPCPTDCICVFSLRKQQLCMDCQNRPSEMTNLTEEVDILLLNTTIPPPVSFDPQNLTYFQIGNSSLSTIPSSVCQLAQLQNLILDHNAIRQLPDNCFVRMKQLNVISVCHNVLTEIQDGLFDGLSSLQSLNFTDNIISTIGRRVFTNASNLTSLTSVDFTYNSLTSVDTWPYILGSIAGKLNQIVNVFFGHNNISYGTNLGGLNLGCKWKYPTYLFVDASYNSIQHISDIYLGLGIRSPTDLRCIQNGYKNRDGHWDRAVHFLLKMTVTVTTLTSFASIHIPPDNEYLTMFTAATFSAPILLIISVQGEPRASVWMNLYATSPYAVHSSVNAFIDHRTQRCTFLALTHT